MRKISFLFLFCLLLASCEKHSDNLTVLLNQSGTLTVKVIDSSQNGFKGAEVSIISSITDVGAIHFDSTDVNGMCNIGKILQGNYEYYVVAEKDNKTYSLSGYFQVIAGDAKEIIANPFLNVGDARVKIVNMSSEAIVDINVALLPHPYYSNNNYFFQDLIDEAYAIGKTDSGGWVEFQDIPVSGQYGFDYSVLVYFDSNNYDYSLFNNNIYITRDSKRNFTIAVDL